MSTGAVGAVVQIVYVPDCLPVTKELQFSAFSVCIWALSELEPYRLKLVALVLVHISGPPMILLTSNALPTLQRHSE